MAIIHTFDYVVDINGYEYELKVEYTVHRSEFSPGSGKVDAEIEIQSAYIYNENKEKIGWPFLTKIDDEIIEAIKGQRDD